ncbi:MAG: nucleotide exchange factor GrpE [Gemmatimonadota bacterium]|nr:nucleotide exchange factor GrpE [Gemmatimonadota bacterium]
MADSTRQDDFLNGDGVPAADAAATPPLVDTDERGAGAQDQDGIGDRISELQRDLTTERDKLLRLAAEFDNYRKRMMRERLEAEARGKAELVKDILEPLDDIARFAHVDPAVTDSTTLVEGVAMVERKLEKTLRTAGLEPMNPVGEPFDPARHEAVGTEPAAAPDDDGTVGRVYQIGYTFKGQLLRPARVVVRQYTDAD